MTNEQADRLIRAIESIADSLDTIQDKLRTISCDVDASNDHSTAAALIKAIRHTGR